ncbi:CPBP family intramembrane glutamic endopeptidase [Bacillus sp. 1P06AnD]|uniref:CPBP family intramembrane glutamic endopeptidase n=1 Tax=Bacillus sp. 1P06AnD TaxID=3132208 RepID=UPI0039A02AA0
MKSCATDLRFLLGLVSAQILLFLTYQHSSVFWYLYTASILFMICFAMTGKKQYQTTDSTLKKIAYGSVSAILLYALFALGNELFSLLHMKSLTKDVAALYKMYSPEAFWQFFVLFVVLIPGEEIFWRGYIQQKLSTAFPAGITVLLSTLLYAVPMLYSGNTALFIAGIAGGLVWALLYQWKKSLMIVIVSHLLFDFLLLFLWPLA